MRFALRDAAVGYASRGIPVLPLHYPIIRPQTLGPLPAGQPGWSTGCSCRDPACAQVGKHPLGALVPHGLTEATTNRARVLAWGNRVHQASTRARLVVASLRPWGTRAPRGCLPTWPQAGSRHEQLVDQPDRPGWPAASGPRAWGRVIG